VGNFGERLKEERERLGLSQAAFAKACGVGRTAQFNYEREERSPSSEYLDAADKLGADSAYIMTGTKRGDDWAYARAYKEVLYTIEMLLGLDEDTIPKIVLMRMDIEKALADRVPFVSLIAYNEEVIKWTRTTKKLDRCMDVDFFASILTAIETTIESNRTPVSPAKKSAAAVMLYQAFKRSGNIDQEIVENAVKLAGA
jgi:transcriptional regulator with XRE-family HTH domain